MGCRSGSYPPELRERAVRIVAEVRPEYPSDRPHKQQDADRMKLGSAWADTGLVFTTRTGKPIEPRNFVRSFVRIRDSNGIRKIRLHAIRHTTASLLKDLGVPARDTQIILGHAHISTTQQIYTHVDEAARREALLRLNKLLRGTT